VASFGEQVEPYQVATEWREFDVGARDGCHRPGGFARHGDGAVAPMRSIVLTQWTAHVQQFADTLDDKGFAPVVLRGGMGAKARSAALERLQPAGDGSPLLVVATGPYVGEGFDCPVLDTLFLAAPIAFKGRLVQYVGRILRPHPGKTTAEVHDYHDINTGVLASSLAKRAPGYVNLGFPDPRRSASTR
jgi:superfamily II DNA or RNA helicase